MKIVREVFVACLLVPLLGCASKHIAYKSSDPRLTPYQKAQSIPIWLPQTVLEFKCTASVVTAEPSLLYLEAIKNAATRNEELRKLKAVASELGVELNTSEVTVTKYALKEPSLTARGERDPTAMYYVKLDRGMFSKVEFSGQFSPDGTPGSISSSAENKGFEFTMKTIEVAAGIAGKALFASALGNQPSVFMNVPDPANLPSESILKRVRDKLQELRDARLGLVTGGSLNAQVDEKVLSKMLEEIAKAEESLLAFFTGASKTKSFPLVVKIRPKTAFGSPFPLLRFDKALGFAPGQMSDDVMIDPIPPELQANGIPSGQLLLKLSDKTPAESAMFTALTAAKASEQGLPYRVPARSFARIVLTDAGGNETRTYLAAEALIAQWGEVAQLPPSMGSVGSAFKPVYYTDTGSLKELTVSGTALSPDSLSSLDKATGSITDALKAKADREAATTKDQAAKADELNQLKYQADKLEQLLRIKGYQEKLPPEDQEP